MTHVLIIPSFYPHPGDPLAGVFFREQALALRKRGLRVGVVHPDVRSLRERGRRDLMRNLFRLRIDDASGVATYQATFPAIPKSSRARSKVWLWQLDRLIARYVAVHGEPHVVHAHGILWAGVGAVRARFSRTIPMVMTAHSTAFARGLIRRWEEGPIREALHGADAVIAVSRALLAELARYAPGVPVEVVPNLIDTDFFSLGKRSEPGEFRWLVVAALKEHKGHASLLHAFSFAFLDRDNVSLRIAGAGPESRRLEKLSRDLDLADRVQFLGALSRQEVRDEMHRANAFVLPSRVETFGVVLIEAMATGLPVVATQSGGPEDIVYPDVGHLVASDDPAALAEAMASVYQNRLEWRQRSAAIRSYVDDKYSERAVTDLILNIYQRVTQVGS